MRPFSVVSPAVLTLGIAACSQAPAKAAEAETDTGKAESAADSFNISFPGEEADAAGSASDSGGFNFNIPEDPTQASGGFNLPTPDDGAAELPSLPESDVAVDPDADDEPIIRLD